MVKPQVPPSTLREIQCQFLFEENLVSFEKKHLKKSNRNHHNLKTAHMFHFQIRTAIN